MASINRQDNGSWRAFIRRKGHTPISKSFKRKSDAEKWAARIETDIAEGLHVQASRRSVRSLMEKFRDEVCPTRDGGTWEITRINHMLRTQAFVNAPIADASEPLHLWKQKRAKEVSGSTVLREMGLLSGIFTHARKEWRIKMATNPVALLSRPPPPKARKRRIKQSEFDAICGIERKLFKRRPTIIWYLPPIFEFAIETGLRVGELVVLEWEDVHDQEEVPWIYVRAEARGGRKTRSPREVPLSDRAVAILKELPRSCDWVFPISKGSLDTVFRRVVTRLGIEDLHFHDTRHEAVSRLAKIYPIAQLAAIIGHDDLNSLKVYYNPTIQELGAYLRAGSQPTAQRPSPTT